MQFEGALIREQGVTFAVVIVEQHVVANKYQAQQAIRAFAPVFPGVPIVLMAQDSRGRATYYGRRDIARFMSSMPLSTIPWKRYTLS